MSHELENKFVAKSISGLYLKSDLADVYFAFSINGETIKVPAHKTILAVASPVFRAMFFGPMKENEVVEIVDVDESAFKEFLQFFYLPKVTLSMENIEAVVQLVDKYDMMECLNSCVEFLESKLTDENMIWGLQLAISMNNEELKEFCQNKIQLLTSESFKSDFFLHCNREVVKQILQLEALSCSEVELFEACVAWAKVLCQSYGLDENDPDNLKNRLDDCFYLIRFGAMTIEETGLIMSNELNNGLFTKEELLDIYCMKSVENFKPKIFRNTPRTSLNYQWDSNNVLTCFREEYSGYEHEIHNRESTRFSTNAPVLLGEISFPNVYGSCGFFNIKFIMNIIEYEDRTFGKSGANKVLFTGTVECTAETDGFISLTRPIIINPKRMYEIRLEKQSSERIFHGCTWYPEVEVDEDLTVTFHKSSPDVSDQNGLVSSLQFNRIHK